LVRIVQITIEASPEHPEILTVQDALQQVLDFFNLLTDDSDPNVEWKLTLASTNSPLTVQGEPVDMRTYAGAFGAVEDRVAIVQRNFERVAHGLNFDDSFPKEKLVAAKRILKRNTNGIGVTSARFSNEESPVVIAAATARNYFSQVEAPAQSLHSYLFSRTSRREQGSIEGRIASIGTDYGNPALRLIEHKSGREISCQIDHASADELADRIKAKDAWDKRRVRIRGTLNYGDDGKVFRVVGGSIAFINPAEVDIGSLADDTFTEGDSVHDYLNRLRDGNFGG